MLQESVEGVHPTAEEAPYPLGALLLLGGLRAWLCLQGNVHKALEPLIPVLITPQAKYILYLWDSAEEAGGEFPC